MIKITELKIEVSKFRIRNYKKIEVTELEIKRLKLLVENYKEGKSAI